MRTGEMHSSGGYWQANGTRASARFSGSLQEGGVGRPVANDPSISQP